MESPMPVSVKKLLADLIEMYRIYGETMFVVSQMEVHPIYILHIEALYENRILDPLEEADALRSSLPAHFEQIKYECHEFNIRFQTEIYNNTANLRDTSNLTFKGDSKLAIIKAMPQTIKLFEQDLNRLRDSLVKYAAFFGDESKNNYSKILETLWQQLGNSTLKELPAITTTLIAKLLPENVNIDIKDALKFINNRAVVAIIIRLIQYEPWTTLTNPDAIQKFFGYIDGPNDERFKKIFSSPAAMQSMNAVRFTKEQEEKLFVGNREFIVGLAYFLKANKIPKYNSYQRKLINLNQGNLSFLNIVTNK
ncbi:MAG: hypothetical protein K1X55_18180 [Chitinophagales bacterium]|nr:hypothetical protein [Chitinophagales bacterium]